ncbi:putative pentatricopeptide repeat-containing protein At3g23330 isoform X2 [Spinacia oleracea]|uniref:Pentatricopeptide repeat-containing protein At3g23330 isoform X2 n=1 Tax=Spinacia oleracea TaxID=3562 RepID=A0A9R0IEW2_SPIOL|nr:putative pentatricopeptide repeat-containing protein At3g23330 isoform X2 [Spinacia oleracea]XP_056683354.1 putative pentatricopeptide repeat-containing protein At3g23330 isoform X2 [Spinacia oleracea]XP_056683355.1 putative pentatricopeptide repeat-containing protein At3g23330 isoform X2 [Spinacia oleracea]XP_056683356.1 putative pentatricopeptide repeat-containing protein At3g23330 isoform X2 [Spinacia oleracea]XP_056683357.1 putative pentatricopeptide repeat-containing protein At3g23330 i
MVCWYAEEKSVICSLNHFTSTNKFNEIKKFHGQLLRKGFLFSSLDVLTKLMYSCITVASNKNTLQSLTSFISSIRSQNPLPLNILLAEFNRNGFFSLALRTLSLMHIHGVPLDSYALCSALTAASSANTFNFGKQMHTYIVKAGWSGSVFAGSAVVGLYSRSLLIDDAEIAFHEIPMKNSVCANALLAGYGEAKLWIKGIELLRKMPLLNLNYDPFTLTAALCACAGLSAIGLGKQVHAYVLRTNSGLETDVVFLSSLIEMYGRCGLVSKALQVFNLSGLEFGEKKKRDIVLWTSMLGSYGRSGHYIEVVQLYRDMLVEGVRPDKVAFVAVISACAHTGEVDLGLSYFESMIRDFRLDPGTEHFSCIVDLLCKAGELEKAWKLVNQMTGKGLGISVSLWGALLNACKDRGNVNLARMAAKKALELDPQNAGVLALLSNLYAKFDMWDEIEQLSNLMKEQGIKKAAGCSWIEMHML